MDNLRLLTPPASAARPAVLAMLMLLGSVAATPSVARAAFGLTSDANFFTVDTGAGLVFKVRRTDDGVNTRSPGDIASLVFNGVEYQNKAQGSHVNSGFDYLYKDISAVDVSAAKVGNFVKVTVRAGGLTHYYLARDGQPHVYMATHFESEPNTLGLCRYIVRVPSKLLPNGPAPSDIRATTRAVESGDIFAQPDGQTRSKHYSNRRLIDWPYFGATGKNVGAWMVRDNNEGGSGGPFYRSLIQQCGTDQELTYIVNYGMAQPEAFRTGVLNTYTLAFTTGAPPKLPLDTAWFAGLGLTGYLADAGRGRATGVAIAGRDTKYPYTVGFANAAAQYWTAARATDGYFSCSGMRPGTYTRTIYKNELAVHTGSVTVTAGGTAAANTLTISDDPSRVTPLWRIGDWDGSPAEFLNGDKNTTMHPSDARITTWTPGDYTVGKSAPATGFPCYQWKDVNGTQAVRFDLSAGQLAARTVRVGITVAQSGARPKIAVNSWNAPNPAASNQPETRSLTVGTYRGNNTTYTFAVPASAFVAGTNTLWISPISGSGGAGFLSAGYSIDCVDLY